ECIRSAAVLSNTYAQATTPKISIITGNAFGASYVALACNSLASDITMAWSDAKISALPIESAVEFLWSEKLDGIDDVKAKTSELVDEYINTVASPIEYAINGDIDGVISPENTRQVLINTIDMLCNKRESTLPKKHSTI
ncbi:MAG: carboxyl transferase domain-containing protein, partial [Oscillospiraceae bacterium]